MKDKLNIAICIPSPDMVHPEFAFDSLPGIIAQTKALPNVENVTCIWQTGVRTDRNRNVMLQRLLNHEIEWDYILWLDADMVYPEDMVEAYLDRHPFDVMGCLYFKKSDPYAPVGYINGSNPIKPYKQIDPTKIDKDKIYTVGALGYGGMMVSMDLYRRMGDDKWTKYGSNFHIPYDTVDHGTHDMVFCETAKKYGAKIMLHGAVRPFHIGKKQVGEQDFIDAKYEIKVEPRKPQEKIKTDEKVAILMPTITKEKAEQTAKILGSRAGYENHEIHILLDEGREGFIKKVNKAVQEIEADYYVYLADDVFPGRDWLKHAVERMRDTRKGFLGFHDGKWHGQMASFGMIDKDYLKVNYGGLMFFPEYKSHYADVEQTVLAMAQNNYCFDPKSLLVEIDYDKDTKSVNKPDRELFRKRKKEGFDGRIKNPESFDIFD